MSEITVGQYLFLDEWKPLKEALESAPILKTENLEGNPQDVVTFLSGEKAVLLFVSLGSKDDLIALANLVKMSKKVLKDIPCKIVVTNFTGNKNIEKAILKMGVLDILEDGIKPRALRFKIDFWAKSLAHSLKSKPKTEVKKESKTSEQNQAEKKNDAPVWIAPLDEEADIWLVKNELEIKKILGRWLVKMMGPSPHVSSWVEVEGQRGVWKYQVKDTHQGIFLLTEGTWYFRGDNKPEYHWKEHLWTMAGDKIELFYQKNKVVTPRFFIKDKVLQIAKNSDYAKTKKELIFETFNQEQVFKSENKEDDEFKGIDGIDDLAGNLEGKSNTDQLGSSQLSGKTKTGADHLSDLSGKGKTDNLDSDPLSGVSETDSLSSLYNHESKKSRPLVNAAEEEKTREGFQESSKGPMSGKSETSQEESFYKNQSKHKESATNDQQAGAAGKNNFGGGVLEEEKDNKNVETHYKNHNEATKYDGKKDMHGKSSTSEEESFYKNASKHKESVTKDHQEGAAGKNKYGANALDEEKDNNGVETHYKNHNEAKQYEGKDLSGKSSTSHEDGHYKNPSKNKEAVANDQQAGAAGKNNYGGGALDEEKDNKAVETHYKEHNKATQYEGKDLSGKGRRADEISGHMSSKNNSNGNEKNKENGFHHPTTNLADLPDDAPRADKKPNISGVNEKSASQGSASNVYPIRPKVDEEIGFKVEEEVEHLLEGESPLNEITQNEKLYSFITQGSIKRLCDFDDYFDEMIILRVSGGDFMELQPVQLDLSFHYQKEKTPLKVVGIIEGVDHDESNFYYVTVKAKSEQANEVDNFVSLFQKRQNHIDQFIKRAKGL